MKNIPVRSIKFAEAKPDFPESFKIRTVAEVLSGQDMVQDSGLAAGMALGRAVRKVLIIDSGNSCNR